MVFSSLRYPRARGLSEWVFITPDRVPHACEVLCLLGGLHRKAVNCVLFALQRGFQAWGLIAGRARCAAELGLCPGDRVVWNNGVACPGGAPPPEGWPGRKAGREGRSAKPLRA